METRSPGTRASPGISAHLPSLNTCIHSTRLSPAHFQGWRRTQAWLDPRPAAQSASSNTCGRNALLTLLDQGFAGMPEISCRAPAHHPTKLPSLNTCMRSTLL